MSLNDHRAHKAVAAAIRQGDLAPATTCVLCGSTNRVVHHHASYHPDEWLNVVALCRTCHQRVHFAKIPDPGAALLSDPTHAVQWPSPRKVSLCPRRDRVDAYRGPRLTIREFLRSRGEA